MPSRSKNTLTMEGEIKGLVSASLGRSFPSSWSPRISRPQQRKAAELACLRTYTGFRIFDCRHRNQHDGTCKGCIFEQRWHMPC